MKGTWIVGVRYENEIEPIVHVRYDDAYKCYKGLQASYGNKTVYLAAIREYHNPVAVEPEVHKFCGHNSYRTWEVASVVYPHNEAMALSKRVSHRVCTDCGRILMSWLSDPDDDGGITSKIDSTEEKPPCDHKTSVLRFFLYELHGEDSHGNEVTMVCKHWICSGCGKSLESTMEAESG